MNLFKGFLHGANFKNTRMASATLCKANFQLVDFEKSVLIDSDFRGSLLSAATFKGAQLLRTKFDDADVSSANFLESKNLAPDQLAQACFRTGFPPDLPAGITMPKICP